MIYSYQGTEFTDDIKTLSLACDNLKKQGNLETLKFVEESLQDSEDYEKKRGRPSEADL